MITKQTVLVLGAGASQPYGFPTAAGLLKPIYASINGNTVVHETLEACGFALSEIETFCKRIKDSGQYSIDAFIEREPRFERMGKAAIAIELLPFEWNMFRSDVPETIDWYRYLFAKMMPVDRDAFRANQLKIVTFNFDRSFEWRLAKVLAATYDLNDQTAATLAGAIGVVHVHGVLAGESPASAMHAAGRDKGPTPAEVTACVEQIRIGREEGSSNAVHTARAWLENADVVCFLGFSFNKDNLDKLQAGGLGAKTIHGTRLYMSDSDVNGAYRYFNSGRQNYLLSVDVRGFFDAVNVFSS